MKTPFPFRILTVVAASMALSESAHASFHFFDIREIYTNGSGSVQFIELFTTSSGQQFLSGHTVTFQIGGVTQNTRSLSTLPTDSANKSVLVGTANLITLFGVTPDFVIPANFFSAGATHVINFGENTDRVNLTLLPNDGTSSLNGQTTNGGQTAADTSVNQFATPTNFAGQTATIPEPAAPLFGLLSAGAALLGRRRK